MTVCVVMMQENNDKQSKPIMPESIIEECDLTDEDAILMVYDAGGQLQYKVTLNIYI